jgi:sugar-specific transcriptional regulator TrmB
LEFQPSEVQTLINLGLTSIQARIYLSLARYGPSSVTAITKQSKVNRPDVYRTVVKLYDLGLVEKIVETPILFKAVSAGQALKFLLQKRTEQYDKLRVDTESLMLNLRLDENKLKFEDSRFVLIPQKDAVFKRVMQAINEAQECMDFVVSWKRFSASEYGSYPERANTASVVCRCILEQPLNRKDLEFVRKIKQELCCNFRFISSHPKAVFGIFDKKEIIVVEDPKSSLHNSPALWTNNQSIVIMAQTYFDNLWDKASENPL